jgi:tripartite-type tricarboxylate transporter receptor subunit TctC
MQGFKNVSYLLIAMAYFLAPCHAQNWPDKPIHLYVSQGAGGGQDTIARYLGDKVSAILGQAIVVENRPGAGGIIGMQTAARAAPDGYNFVMTSSATMASNPYLVKNLPYKPLDDFEAVAMISKPGFLISANPTLPFSSIPQLISYAKAHPGQLTVAIDGARNASGLIAGFLNKKADINIRLIPYSSPNQGLQDTIAGSVSLFVSPPGVQLAHIAAGKLRPLGVSGTTREIALPDVAMIGENLEGFHILGWLMISAPKNTPREAIDKMNAAFDSVLKNAAVKEWMRNFGSPSSEAAGRADDLRAFVKDEITTWGKMIAEVGLEAQ